MRLYQRADGYLTCKHKGKMVYFHRLVWEANNGSIPKGMTIDHINRDRMDCRLENLRLVDYRTNNFNRGAKGYCYVANRGKWKAHIKYKGKNKARMCDTEEQAKKVRRIFELLLEECM